MKITADRYSFEIPEHWKELVGVRKRGRRVDIYLLREEDPDCSGLLVSLKCLKREVSKPDAYTELRGRLIGAEEETWLLYAVYGQEGAVSEENEDLYWRIRDQLWMVFDGLRPAEGYRWQTV